MGLDTSHNCWHGPYSAFSRFRNALAAAAGYGIERVTANGFTHDDAQINWRSIEHENPNCYAGEWNAPQPDALVYLLAHSDCDGVLHPAQAAPLADRIAELIPKLPDDGYTRGKAEAFVTGLRDAVAKGEDVDFH